MDPWRSHVTGVVWPGLTDGASSRRLAFRAQLDMTQWWPTDDLAECQQTQLAALHRYHGISNSDRPVRTVSATLASPATDTSPALNDRDLTDALIARACQWHRTRPRGQSTQPARARYTVFFGIDPVVIGAIASPSEHVAIVDTFEALSALPLGDYDAYLHTTSAQLLRSWQFLLRAKSWVGVHAYGAPSPHGRGEAKASAVQSGFSDPAMPRVATHLFVPSLGVIGFLCPEAPVWHLPAEGILAAPLDDEQVTFTPLHEFTARPTAWTVSGVQLSEPCTCGRGLPTLTPVARP